MLLAQVFVFDALVTIFGGVLLALTKPPYVVRMATAGGRHKGLVSKDEDFVSRVVASLNQALIQRG